MQMILGRFPVCGCWLLSFYISCVFRFSFLFLFHFVFWGGCRGGGSNCSLLSLLTRPMSCVCYPFPGPGTSPNRLDSVLFRGIDASISPMLDSTDTKLMFGGSLASPSGRAHFRKNERENKHQ